MECIAYLVLAVTPITADWYIFLFSWCQASGLTKLDFIFPLSISHTFKLATLHSNYYLFHLANYPLQATGLIRRSKQTQPRYLFGGSHVISLNVSWHANYALHISSICIFVTYMTMKHTHNTTYNKRHIIRTCTTYSTICSLLPFR